MAELPLLYDAPGQITRQRARYRAALDTLAAAAQSDPALRSALAAAIGSSQPFFLPYQGHCDRELQARYGALLGSLVPPDPTIVLAGPPAPGQPIRVGIVTGFACEHTVWRLMTKAWLTHLDRDRFSVALYHTGGRTDSETQAARHLADRYAAPTSGAPAADLRAAILADRPHVLIYPELGMDPACIRLATERLAPVQCVAWGHPHSSGLPQIDYFLSGAAMEPPHAALHYTERLVCLPHLGVHPMLDHTAPDRSTRDAFGLAANALAFWCGQALYKYLPQYDEVFVRIALAIPRSQFLFIAFAKSAVATQHFRQRLARAFAAHGIDAANHCVIVDSMSQARFHASVRACDIVLDSIGWSGGKSTLDMLADSPVIVTHEGGLMRGRHTAAILRSLGLTETIASSIDAYVAIAIKLADAPDERAKLRARLASARHWLLDDMSPIRALERWLVQITAPNPA